MLKVNDSDGYKAEIFTVNRNGSFRSSFLAPSDGAAGELDISIDDKFVIYTKDISGFENDDYRQLNSQLFLFDFDAGTSENLSEEKEEGFNDLDPRFSPNESDIIFTYTNNDGQSTRFIRTVAISSKERSNVIDDEEMPNWE